VGAVVTYPVGILLPEVAEALAPGDDGHPLEQLGAGGRGRGESAQDNVYSMCIGEGLVTVF
jgi:hypothetical protein